MVEKLVNKVIDFYFDVGSTNSYFALKLLQPIAEKHQASINWHPFNLGHVFKSNNYVLMDEPYAKMRNRKDDLMRWAARYQLPFCIPDQFPIKTSRALKACIVMREFGQEAAFINKIFDAYWQDNEGRIGEYDCLQKIAATMGIDSKTFLERCEAPETRQALIDSTNNALEAGVFGAPTIVIGSELYWGKDRMMFVEDQLSAL